MCGECCLCFSSFVMGAIHVDKVLLHNIAAYNVNVTGRVFYLRELHTT
jgi:hypothetical protein